MSNQFESLPIFQPAHQLVLFVYQLTKKFPSDEKYALTSQLRRSAASVPANIVEGNARKHPGVYLEFLYIAHGSLEETKYHLYLAQDLEYISTDEYTKALELAESIGKQLHGLIHFLQKEK